MKSRASDYVDKKWENVIAQNIIYELDKRNLSILEFSKIIGINPNTVYRITWGNYNPSLLTLTKISNGLNIPLSNLFKE